ncbi:response regulator transcription factor [Roseomonas stagni]|uniref:Response regulator transcription factor n=1 Tax=Falsiroseomonas algicola TaxID=2716930 RepID=A0A6M1LTI1_9PROT|nr:response regulator transcription factor [Falsiroseomonas algicola]NGM23806.1 response regulator transcription factor [Falsiroseomonas algicola]
MRILLGATADDQAPLRRALTGAGRFVEQAPDFDGIGATTAASGPFDAVVLSVDDLRREALPVLRDIRRQGVQAPILVIAGAVSPAEEAAALNHGADDLVARPVANPVVVARVQAMVRRTAAHAPTLLVCGNVALDRDRQAVSVDGRPVNITSREFEVLETLLLRRSALLSKERFMSRLYGDEEGPDQRIIDVFVCKLRRKLAAAGAAEIVRTVWGLGYVAEDPGPAAVAAARARYAAGQPRARRAHLVPAAGFVPAGA